MARIKYASIVSSVSGSVGSATFQKSLYGDTLRNKPRPRRSSTSSQQYCRNIMNQLHTAWAALSDDQRQNWNQFISFAGSSIRRDRNVLQSGHSYFLRYNFLRLLQSYAIQQNPLYNLLTNDITLIQCYEVIDDHSVKFYFESVNMADDFFPIIKMYYSPSPSKNIEPSRLRFIHVDPADFNTFDIATQFLTIFGKLLQAGDYIFYSYQLFGITNTLISQVYTGRLLIAAN
jgi:hypothetical protein